LSSQLVASKLCEVGSPAKADPCEPCLVPAPPLRSLRCLLCHPPAFRVFRVFRGSPHRHPEPREGSIRIHVGRADTRLPTKRSNKHEWIDPIHSNTEATESAEEELPEGIHDPIPGARATRPRALIPLEGSRLSSRLVASKLCEVGSPAKADPCEPCRVPIPAAPFSPFTPVPPAGLPCLPCVPWLTLPWLPPPFVSPSCPFVSNPSDPDPIPD